MSTNLSRRTDPETSREAAASHAGIAQSHRETILSYVRTFCMANGKTSAEISVAVGLERHEAARRLADLLKSGDVRQGPSRKCSTNGNSMMTWLPALRGAQTKQASETQRSFL